MKTYLIILLCLASCCRKQEEAPRKQHHYIVSVIPPVKYADIYIIAGQSNCGRPKWSEAALWQKILYGAPIPSFLMYNNRYDYTPNYSPKPLKAGVNTGLYTMGNPTEFGPEVSLFTSLARDGKSGYVVKVGIGNTNLATQWAVDSFCYKYLIYAIDSTMSIIHRAGLEPRFKAFIWMQGENDATNKVWAENYFDNLLHLLMAIRGAYSPLINVVGRINGANDPSEVYRGTVRRAQDAISVLPHTVVINTDSYELQDGVHYSVAGQIQFGLDIYNVIK